MATSEDTVSSPAPADAPSKIVPIRPGADRRPTNDRAAEVAERAAAVEDLDRRTGYSGTIQGGTLDEALDEQRGVLWNAEAIVSSVAQALETQFGRDWPAGVPDYRRALRRAVALIEAATGALEAGVLEDRALAISRERDPEEPGEESP